MKIRIDDLNSAHTSMIQYHVANLLGIEVRASSLGHSPENEDLEDDEATHWAINDYDDAYYISDAYGFHSDSPYDLLAKEKISILCVRQDSEEAPEPQVTCTASMLCNVDGKATWLHATSSDRDYAVPIAISKVYLKSKYGEEVDIV